MRRVDDQTLYDELIDLCYECVLDDSAWRPLLKRLIAASGRQQGLLLYADYRKNNALNLNTSSPFDSENCHYCNLDPGHDFVHSRTLGQWYHNLIDFGSEHIRHDPFFQNVHIPHGPHNLFNVKLEEHANSAVYLTVLNGVDAPTPTARQQDLLTRVTPHLLKVAKLSSSFNCMELELVKRDLLLDNHSTPLWLLDGEGHVLHCNRTAALHMRQGSFSLLLRFAALPLVTHMDVGNAVTRREQVRP